MGKDEFYQEFLAEVREEQNNHSLDHTAFFAAACNLLQESDAIIDYEPAYLREGAGTKNFMCIDGYDFAAFEQDESMVLIVCDDTFITKRFNQADPHPETISTKECTRYMNGVLNFIQDSLSGRFLTNHEESTPVYGLAADIHSQRKKIVRFRIYIVTDRIYNGHGLNNRPLHGVEVHIWDLKRLESASRSRAPQESLTIDLRRYDPEGIWGVEAPNGSDEFTTFLLFLRGDVLADLYGRYGAKLMESNVRSFLSGRGKVNKGIRETLRSDPAHFVAFNNGITATTTDIEFDVASGKENEDCRILKLENLQIVNGGQTTASIFYAGQDDRVDLSKIVVPAKVVLVKDKSVADQLIPDISRYTNSQNAISEADLSANSEFQIQLEQLSQQVLSPIQVGDLYPTRWYYERARKQYDNAKNALTGVAKKQFMQENPRKQVITKTDCAKYIFTWEQHPNVVSLGAQKCFTQFAMEMNDSEDALQRLTPAYYRKLICIKILFDTARKYFWHDCDWYQGGYLANITTYAIAKIAYDYQRAGIDWNFDEIWRIQRVPETLLSTINCAGRQASQVLNDPNRPTQNVSEWAKKIECWQALKKRISCISRDLTDSKDMRTVKQTHDVNTVNEAKTSTESLANPSNGLNMGRIGFVESKEKTYTSSFSSSSIGRRASSLPTRRSRHVAPRDTSVINWDEVTSWGAKQLLEFGERNHMLSPRSKSALEDKVAGVESTHPNINALNFLLGKAKDKGFKVSCLFLQDSSFNREDANSVHPNQHPLKQVLKPETRDAKNNNPLSPRDSALQSSLTVDSLEENQRTRMNNISAKEWNAIMRWARRRHLLDKHIEQIIQRLIAKEIISERNISDLSGFLDVIERFGYSRKTL